MKGMWEIEEKSDDEELEGGLGFGIWGRRKRKGKGRWGGEVDGSLC